MQSGNFLIGKGLRLNGFDNHILPILTEKECVVSDRIEVETYMDSPDLDRSVLISLSGNCDLEVLLNDSLLGAGADIQMTADSQGIEYGGLLALPEHLTREVYINDDKKFVGIYKVIGIYGDKDTASHLFSSIAQGYLIDGISAGLRIAEQGVRRLFGG